MDESHDSSWNRSILRICVKNLMLGFFFLIVEAYKAFAMGSFEPAISTFLLSFLKTDNSSTDYDKNPENILE